MVLHILVYLDSQNSQLYQSSIQKKNQNIHYVQSIRVSVYKLIAVVEGVIYNNSYYKKYIRWYLISQ